MARFALPALSAMLLLAAAASEAEDLQTAVAAEGAACMAQDGEGVEDACHLHLLQRRASEVATSAVDIDQSSEDEAFSEHAGEDAHTAEWSILGTTEKCCKCKNGVVGWSVTGKCSFCNGKKNIQKKKSVHKANCTKASKTFKGNSACAKSCKSAVGLLETEALELLLPHAEEAALVEMDAKDGAVDTSAADEGQAAEWSVFGTAEKCCKCKNGVVGWSASGKCSFCNGKKNIQKKFSVFKAHCTKASNTFKGNSACARSCRSTVGLLEAGAVELLLTDTEEAALVEMDANDSEVDVHGDD